jgi:SAM-dependent methyltransferase
MDLLGKLFSVKPVRKAIWRLWYPFLTRRLKAEDVCFLNYAFETEPPVGLPLEPEDEADRACIQLYAHVISGVDLRDKAVLEVSCGHGGGASWIARTMRPASYVGLDLNPAGIRFCSERHRVDGLKFVRGDAGRLPFPDASLDAVINVEASHCYPNFSAFLAEVHRVLRPGGQFLYADFRFAHGIDEWLKDVDKALLKIDAEQDISAEVQRGMDRNAASSLALVETCMPRALRRIGRDFAGVPGSAIYDALASGELSYRSWHMHKKG